MPMQVNAVTGNGLMSASIKIDKINNHFMRQNKALITLVADGHDVIAGLLAADRDDDFVVQMFFQ